MPIYLDVHMLKDENVQLQDVITAHLKDLNISANHGVIQKKFWADMENKKVFCLMEGPSMDACNHVHAEAHGMTACNMVEITDEEYNLMLIGNSKNDLAYSESDTLDPGIRTILLIELRPLDRRNKTCKNEILKRITQYSGHIMPNPQDYFLVSFESVSNALNCAVSIKKKTKGISNVLENKIAAITSHLLGKDSMYLFEEAKNTLDRIKRAGDQKVIYLDEKTFSIWKKNTDSSNFGTHDFHVLNASDLNTTEKMFDLLDSELTDSNFGVDQMCRALGWSKATAYRTTTRLFNKSPIDLIRELRFQNALDLLNNKSMTMSEIAYESGFSSPGYFSRSFKDRFGIPPKSYVKTG
jgi:AraC-like DNA-binding protein